MAPPLFFRKLYISFKLQELLIMIDAIVAQ